MASGKPQKENIRGLGYEWRIFTDEKKRLHTLLLFNSFIYVVYVYFPWSQKMVAKVDVPKYVREKYLKLFSARNLLCVYINIKTVSLSLHTEFTFKKKVKMRRKKSSPKSSVKELKKAIAW